MDYPNLWGYVRDILHLPGVAETVNQEHIQKHYQVQTWFNRGQWMLKQYEQLRVFSGSPAHMGLVVSDPKLTPQGIVRTLATDLDRLDISLP